MSLLLSGCGDDFTKGFGESEGWGGYTKGFGDVDESYKPLGLCSYTGGCMPEQSEDGTPAANSYKSKKDTSGAHAGAIDSQ